MTVCVPVDTTGIEELTTLPAAEYLGVSPFAMTQWRHRGIGPAFQRRGRRVVYLRSDLDAWDAARRGAGKRP